MDERVTSLEDMVSTIAKDWSDHRVECAQRDAENQARYAKIETILEEIAPWARSNIARDASRREFWDHVNKLVKAEIATVIAKGIGWLLLATGVWVTAHTSWGHALLKSLAP